MGVLTEQSAEAFLEKEGLKVVETVFVMNKKELKDAMCDSKEKIVLKVSGKNIIHKAVLGGVKTNILTYEDAVKAFESLMKIKGAEGVLVQRKIHGTEFLLGLRKTKDFGMVIAFGAGGSKVEEIRDVSFRVVGVDGIEEMINDTKISKNLDSKLKNELKVILLKLANIAERHPDIEELDINPLIVENGKPMIVDARVVFE